jgi:cobalt/nickel transport system permease protein
MKRIPTGGFIALALALAVGLATAVSPFASPNPDGLEKVAEQKAFLDQGELAGIQEDSPIPDYAFPGVENERVATGMAGFVGTLAVFAVGLGLAWLVRRRRVPPSTRERPPEGGPVGAIRNHSLDLTGLAGDPTSPVHRLDPRAKTVGLVGVTVVAVSTPIEAWPVYLACAFVLAVVAARARIKPREIWRRARFVLPLVVLAALFIPLVRTGGDVYGLGPLTVHQAGLETLAAVAAKATIGTVSAVLLAATTTFPSVLRGLEALRVQRILILIAAFMYRYLFVIVEEVGRMRAALAARGYRPRNALHAGALGRVATALFLRTYSRGEGVYLAMLARGYDGRMRRLVPLAFGRMDTAFVLAVLGLLVPLRLAAGVAT